MIPQVIFDDIKQGRAVLVTGAGISTHGGKNRLGKPIISTDELAAKVAKAAGLTYENEDIKEVFEACEDPAGDAKIKRIFESELVETKPSPELIAAMSVCWRRIYTFNLDDTLENISQARRQQRLKPFNACRARAEEWNGYHECQVVHLHGRASEYDSGFVFSHSEYAANGARMSPWYIRLGADFVDYTVIFIGTSLKEELLFQSVQSAVADGTRPGMSFSIVPEALTQIKSESLRKRGITHVQGTLHDFTTELARQFPKGLSITDLDTDTATSRVADSSSLSPSDLDALMSLRPIKNDGVSEAKLSAPSIRRFYEGYGPTAAVIKAGAYARLAQFARLDAKVQEATKTERGIVVLGQAGSGKSTYAMHAAFELSKNNDNVFEFRRGSTGLLTTVNALRRHLRDRQAIVLIDDLNVYYDDFHELTSSSEFSNIFFIASARTGEWNDRLSRGFGDRVKVVTLDRFGREDIQPIINAIKGNFAAPAFIKLPPEKQRARFERSDRQLLIAMMEATEEKGFEQIIEDEFNGIEDYDQRILLLIIAYSTMSRVGVEKSVAILLAQQLGATRNFDDLIKGLEGIVGEANSGRYVARHEVYAREIVMRHGAFDEIEQAMTALVEYFSTFKMPIIKSVSKIDGQLFKYILNNKNIYDIYKTTNMQKSAGRFFEQFELSLQLDGHYWLQYGLLLRRCGDHAGALEKLEKSIRAYPENNFAIHALAQQKLILAAQSGALSSTAKRLIDEAVDTLMKRHYSMGDQRLDGQVDEYPIVTLGYYHIDALVALGNKEEASDQAKKYFNIISSFKHGSSDQITSELSRKLLMLSTNNQWDRIKYRVGNISYL